MLYVGGEFTNIQQQERRYLTQLKVQSADPLTNWYSGLDGPVRALTLDGATLYVGGYFTTANAQDRPRLAAFNIVDSSLQPLHYAGMGGVRSLLVAGSWLYVGEFAANGAYGQGASLSTSDLVSAGSGEDFTNTTRKPTITAPLVAMVLTVALLLALMVGGGAVGIRLLSSPGNIQQRVSARPSVVAATPVLAAVITPRVHLPPANPVRCVICGAATDRDDVACRSCGLLFASRVPPALQALPGYRVLRPLSIGGMSAIYLGRREPAGALCVLKTLASVDAPPSVGWAADALRCLEREAALLGELAHPGIVRRLDWLAAGPQSLLVLDYIAGATLEQHLAEAGILGSTGRRVLPPSEALAIGGAVAEVLASLATQHEPVAHCDIKPTNLLLPATGLPVLIDWGSAVRLDAGCPQAPSPEHFGTPGYAPPELYRGYPEPRSDVYSLGATLYHVLSGDDPADHPLSFPLLDQLPPAIAAALRPMLAHEPAARPGAEQVAASLQRLLASCDPAPLLVPQVA